MRTIFIADAHLNSPDDTNYRMFCRFLAELVGNCQTLYIMGDLFDFWLGFPSKSFIAPHEPVLQLLAELEQSGCRLVYFEGNHDFHLGDVFTKRLHADIHTGPALMEVQGRQLYLCHGDQLNRADYGYRLLRLILHNRLMRVAVRFVPLSLALRIRHRLQHVSRSGYETKTMRWDYREIIRNAAATLQQQGAEGLVAGHFHLPLCEQLDGSGITILSLGDWMEYYSYGEMMDGQLTLKQYRPSD